MALLKRQEIVAALERLGQLATAEGHQLQLLIVGGAAMVLGYQARQSTHDVDVFFQTPPERHVVRKWASIVAQEMNWPDDWLNDGVKGYLVSWSAGPLLHRSSGIEAYQPTPEQLLAMKLCAWRDDVDIGDATHLLLAINETQGQALLWQRLVPFLVPGDELKAQYAFADLWESVYGDP